MARRLVLRLGLAVLFVSLAVQTARADEPDFARSGPYIGVGASRTANLVEAFLDGTPILEDIDISNSWGVNTRLGYRLTSWFALEAEYEWLDRMNASLNGVNVGSLQMQSATANLRLIAPLGRFQPYFLLGAGAIFLNVDTPFNQLEVDHSAFAGRVGLGLDVYLTENVLLNVGAEGLLSPAEVKLNTGSVSVSENGIGTVTFQAGLGFRF
jgi:opacity protein-like surface antigen